ncbi:MAG: YfiR family protein [Planctomycetaceae bacterium]
MAAIFLAWLTCDRPVAAQEAMVNREAPIKAAFIYNFAKYSTLSPEYVRSIANADQTLTIGIVGNSPVEPYLRKISDRRAVNGKSISIVHFDTAASIKPCHVLFVPDSLSATEQQNIAKTMAKHSAFVVAEHSSFPGTTQAMLFVSQNRVQFELNLKAIENAKISLDSRVIGLASVLTSEGSR